jgi:hypothetical protein
MFAWAKPIVGLDGKMHMIQYKLSSMIPWREKTEWMWMRKVIWHSKEVGKFYINFDS